MKASYQCARVCRVGRAACIEEGGEKECRTMRKRERAARVAWVFGLYKDTH